MPIDWNKIKDRASTFYTEASRKVRQYTPENFSKEKKFVNGLVVSLALMTMADKKAETEEVVAAMDLINEIDEIRELEMTQEAIELYEMHIENLSNVVGNSVKWTIEIGKMLSEVGKLKPYPEYPPMIENLIEHISKADNHVDPLEVEMRQKILGAIQ